MRTPAFLVLEDGAIYEGRAYGSSGVTTGEIVFLRAGSGYQEAFTDPAYDGQIVLMTAPHIGNTGINNEDTSSDRYWIAGLIVRDPARRASNWRSTGDLEADLAASGTVGICELDTRAVTRHLRDNGVMRAGIFSLGDEPRSTADMVEAVHASSQNTDQTAVSTQDAYIVEPVGEAVGTVAAIDFGITRSTLTQFTDRGVQVHVVPRTVTLNEIQALDVDGAVLSSGPGDPASADAAVETVRELLNARIPVLGIGFGHQLLSRALGYETYKLTAGHHGGNIPVRDLASGRVIITAHNHGYAAQIPAGDAHEPPYDNGTFGRVEVSHVCLNDDVIEGLRCLDVPAFSIQYRPGDVVSSHDPVHPFDVFIDMMKGQTHAETH